MRCEDVRLEIAPLLSGELAPEQERAVLAHLDGCPACREDADRLRDTWLRLGDLPVQAPDSTRMRQHLLVAIETFQNGIDQARVEALERGRGGAPAAGRVAWTPATLGWIAALAATLVIGVLLGRESVSRQAAATAAPELVALRQELHDTRELVTLALLRQSSAAERLRGVSWSERLDNPGADVVAALLETLAHDANVNVRLAAVDALSRYADRPGVRRGALEALNGAGSAPLVQVALIDLLVQLNDTAAKASLLRLAGDERADRAVRDRAQQALQQLG